MAMSREKMMEALRTKYDVWCRPYEEFSGEEDGSSQNIWAGGEGNMDDDNDALPAFDYYGEEPEYNMGVEVEVEHFLQENGWDAEPYDAGTWIVFVS